MAIERHHKICTRCGAWEKTHDDVPDSLCWACYDAECCVIETQTDEHTYHSISHPDGSRYATMRGIKGVDK